MKRISFDKTSTNICKGIAIILMYIHHSFASEKAWEGADIIFSPLGRRHLIQLSKVSKVCVAIFVFLSAFGVYRSYHAKERTGNHPSFVSENYLKTVTKRYLTLLKNFLIVYLLTQLLSPLIGISRAEVYGNSFLKRLVYSLIDALGLAHALHTPTYNPTWWYMSFAFLLILLLPLLVIAADQLGYAILPLALLLPPLFGFSTKYDFFRYLPAIVLGIIFAKYNIFEWISEKVNTSKIYMLIVAFVSCLLAAILVILRIKLGFEHIIDGLLAAVICCFGHVIIRAIPYFNYPFYLFGVYSMYMFMTHTLIRGKDSRFHALSYAPRHPVLIILLLLLDTLLISMGIDLINKLITQSAGKLFHPEKVSRNKGNHSEQK